jgi:LuxR family transcriptional regulator, quorum-sensing system regulator SolR
VLHFEDYVEQTRQTKTVADLARQYSAAISREGYENCILTSLRGRKVGHVAWFEFPLGYPDAYISHRWEKIDPVLACSLRASRPFLWSDVVEKTELSRPQLTFMEDCKDLNVHSGVVFPFHGPGRRLDVLSISRRTADPPNSERTGVLHALSVQTWTRYLELSDDQLFLEPEGAALTPRELEILRWCKDGKSRPDIGDILSISHKTVEYHLCNVMNKLGANNQITAVVIAIQRGLIEL